MLQYQSSRLAAGQRVQVMTRLTVLSLKYAQVDDGLVTDESILNRMLQDRYRLHSDSDSDIDDNLAVTDTINPSLNYFIG